MRHNLIGYVAPNCARCDTIFISYIEAKKKSGQMWLRVVKSG